MRIDVLTLFPQLIQGYCSESILGIAQEKELLSVHAHNPRDYSTNKHKKVDDIIYGGGAGMLLSPQPFFDCFDAVMESAERDLTEVNSSLEVILCSPSGQVFNQSLAQKLSHKKNLVFLCGRYEGFDDRIKSLATMEVSIGDYVLTGGELPALCMIDSVARLIPGVLGAEDSALAESFSDINLLEELESLSLSKRELSEFLHETGLNDKSALKQIKLLEYPQYTRPEDFRGLKVPEILKSGNHKEIFLWRLKESIKVTRNKRPDLL